MTTRPGWLRRRSVLAGLATVVAGAIVAARLAGRSGALPARLRIDRPVLDLVFDPRAVAEQAPGVPPHVALLQPSASGKMIGAARHALIAPPPSRVRFHVRVPTGGVLRFRVGVEGTGTRDRSAAGVRFEVEVDGKRAFERVVNPARTHADRRWLEARVDLGPEAGRTVEIAFVTRAAGAGRLAGKAGWSGMQLVQESWRERQQARPDAPNVIVLLVDTLRADACGCYGASPSPTPALDALAASGLTFDRAVAQSSWTLTSVASIFSGLYPRSHGVFGVPRRWARPAGASQDSDWGSLADSLPTMAEQAELGGITTIGVSANPLVSSGTNLARGFETFVALQGPRWPPAAVVNATFLHWLRANRGRRFFAYLHYMEPHSPYARGAPSRPAAPAGVRPAVASGDIDTLARHITWQNAPRLDPADVAYLRLLYPLGVQGWDRELAALRRTLGELGIADSTVLIVTADHGEEFQEHGRLEHGSQLYDESVRVPLVIAGPGIRRGHVRAPAQGIDLFPTVAALLGVDVPLGLPGRDLLGTLPPDRPILSETHYAVAPDGSATELVALRTPDWTLIHAPALGRYELYDHRDDPAETRDRFADAPEARALVATLATWQAPPPPSRPATAEDPGLVEKLRALGYVE